MRTKGARQQARYLRSVEARSIKDIAHALGVSQGSVSVWVRDIVLTDRQRQALLDRARVRRNGARSAHFRADPDMVRYFVSFLRHHYGVPDEAFRIDCNLFADHLERQKEIEQFWVDLLDLPPTCLRKSTVNVYSKHSQKKRTNRLPYGTVRVCVHSTEIVQAIYGAIQEYGGFDPPEWLG